MADPLAPFGYTLNKLKAGKDGRGLVCAERTVLGAPLLALPLAACWTPQAVGKECAVLGEVLAAACERNPTSELLRADQTWLVLHLLQERRRGEGATPIRKSHLALLPKVPESLLAWDDLDIEGLKGSWWYDEAVRRKEQAQLDLDALRLELGPAGSETLGLDKAGYLWARQVVEQFGMTLLRQDGSARTLLVPGVELFQPGPTAPTGTAGVRLEQGSQGSAPTLVFYAEKDYYPGDQVALSHGGLACSNGCRLAGCGWLLESNPWDSVQVSLPLRLDKVPGETDQYGELIQGLTDGCVAGLVDGVPEALPGECLHPGPLAGRAPVELTDGDDHVVCEAVLRLTKERPLPTQVALIHIGAALIADQSKQKFFIDMEREVEGVFNNECCERRALIYLQNELQGVLGRYPASSKEGAVHLARAEAEGAVLPRSARSLRLIEGEKQLLVEVLTAVQERLGLLIALSMSPTRTPAPPTQVPLRPPRALQLSVPGGRAALLLPLEDLAAGAERAPGGALGAALTQLGGTTRALEQLTARFLAASAAGRLDAQEGAALKRELGVLRTCLEGCPLGDPSAVAPVPTLSSQSALVQAHSDATVASLSAQVAALEWERARLEKEAGGAKKGGSEPLARVLVELAGLRARLLDFEGAHADLRRGLELKPGLPQALEGAMSLAAQKAEVLAGPASKWSAAAQALKALRERLKDLGYTRAGARWSWPARAPPVKNLASEPAAWSGTDSEKDIVDSALRIKPGAQITKPSRDALPSRRLDPSIMPYVLPRDPHAQELVGLIRLFMLHKALPLSRAKELLGAEACGLLLKSSALTCIRTASGQLLSPDEAAALVPKAAAGADEPEVFSNVLLWPAGEDLLIAVDFEQATSLEGQFEPVPYLGQDSRALLLGAPSSPPATSVLDAFCGSGLQGLAALQRYAKQATFLDSSSRALRFACFNAHLNGLGDRCAFVEGSLCSPQLPNELKSSKFDVILSSPGSLPNPKTAIANGGPCFARGGDDGESLLSALITKAARELLAPAGRLVAVSMVPNAGGLAKRLAGWADASGSEPADLRAVVFRGGAIRDEEYVHISAQGCPPVAAVAYLGALRQAELRSVSEALVLLRVPPAGSKVPKHAPRVETLPERQGLWADTAYLEAEVQGALDGLVAAAALDESGAAPEPLYALDWGEGAKGSGASAVPLVRPGARTGWSALQAKASKNEYSITLDKTAGSNLGAQVNPSDGRTLLIEAVLGGLFKDWNAANPRVQVVKGDRIVEVNGILGDSTQLLEECKQCKVLQVRLQREVPERGPPGPTPSQKGEFVSDSARWKDVALHRLLGWSPPALCDWRWYKTALPLSAKQRGAPPSGFTMALVELTGCRCPSEVRDALRSVNCTHRFTFTGEPRSLKPMDNFMEAMETDKILDRYDCLVLPLETGGGRFRQIHELPIEMLLLIEAVSRYVYSTRRPIRLVAVTCGCSGPSYSGMTDDGYGLPAAAPLRGMFRCSRIENLQLPILHMDSDALVEPGRGKELVAQIDIELELSSPDVGFYKADIAEQNRAIIHTHREVAYRGGARFLPKLDLCARNPIFPGAKIPPLMGSAAEGVCLITGGTGGLGILTAEAMVESGVKVIVLSSRSGKINRDYQGLGLRLDALRMSGARIELEACDSKEEVQVKAMLDKIRANYGPLKWIMNAAGIVMPQDVNLMAAVFEPKCLGAWNFHKLTLTDDIKTFMTYSSMSAGAGANDLSNYAAANTYIDELARLRQSQGLPGVSIMFPEVEEAGMAADMIMAKGNPANIPPGNVKQTIKQIVCGKGPMAPCVAILPQGYLIPRSPTMDSMLEPLKARVDKDLWDRLVRSEASRK